MIPYILSLLLLIVALYMLDRKVKKTKRNEELNTPRTTKRIERKVCDEDSKETADMIARNLNNIRSVRRAINELINEDK